MSIPKYDELQYPALRILGDGKPRKARDMIDQLAQEYLMTTEETEQLYDSGKGPIFLDRLHWALSYLNMAGLVSKPKRGVFQINSEGSKLLSTPDKFRELIDNRIQNRVLTKSKKSDNKGIVADDVASELTPTETLYESYMGIKKSIYRDILDTILTKKPIEFEKLVVQLLQKMGYGGEIKDSGLVTQFTNDNGIDGIIKEDILGFGRIHIQAKRFRIGNNIHREDIQKFVGALAVAKSDKGVFITTSDFSNGAYKYVESLNTSPKIVLINGNRLAEYVYNYNLGMQVENTFEIKKLDSDFWDSMQDELL